MARSLSDAQYEQWKKLAQNFPHKQANQQSNLVAGREGMRRVGSGVLGTVFDVMDQPRAAIAGGLYNALDDDEQTNFLGGFVKGLKGDSHVSGSQILEELGVKNNVLKGVGGFVADVGLDPMTLVGAKRVKGIGREVAEREALQMAAQQGAELNADTISRMTQQIVDSHPSQLQFLVGLPGRKKVRAAIERGEGELRLTTRGGTLATSTAGANALDKIMARAVGVPGEKPNVIARGFSRSAEEPYGIAEINMVNEARATQLHDQHYAVRKDVYSAFDDEEHRLMAEAFEEGTDLSDVPIANPNSKAAKKYGITTLQDGINLARSEREKIFRMQQEAGIIPADAEFNPYELNKVILHPERYSTLPHVNVPTSGGSGQAYDLLRRQTFKQLDDIETALAANGRQSIGVIKNLGASINSDMEASYRQMARARSNLESLQKFGMNAEPGSELEKYFQRGESPLGWVKVPKKDNPFGGIDNPIAKREEFQNTWIPRDVARVLNFSEKVLTDHSTGAEMAGLWQKIQGHWKALVVASPGYFARTSMGDLIMNASDGVRGIKPYERAFKILGDVKAKQDEDVFNAMMDPSLSMGSVVPRSRPGSTHVLGSGRNAVRLSSQDINDRFITEGGGSGIIQTEQVGTADAATRNRAFEHAQRVGTGISGGLIKAEATLADLNNKREKYFRMAHFVDAWDKNLKKGMTDEAASKAAMDSVRKVNIDYRNLSSFERNSVRKVIPFYSWYRRNAQLQMEMLFTKPGFMSLYPKTITAMQNMLGTDEGSGDWNLPQWIRESYPVRVVAGEAKENWLSKVMGFAAGAGTGEAVFAPLATGITPLGDLETTLQPIQKAWDEKSVWGGFKEAGKNLGSMVAPPIRAAAELGTRRSFYSGAPITNWNSWAMAQLGIPGRAGQMATEGTNASAITSMLTGVSLKPIGEKQQRSEFKRRYDILDKTVLSKKKKMAKKYGLDYDKLPQKYQDKMVTAELMREQLYKKWVGKSLGY